MTATSSGSRGGFYYFLWFQVGLLLGIGIGLSYRQHRVTSERLSSRPQVYFSPKGGCTEAIVQRITLAREECLVQAYSFTSARIAEALVLAKKRGVEVEVILDKSDLTGNGTQIETLAKGGVPIWIDDRHAIAHNKVMVVDEKYVLTGSFNFSNAAEERNAENLVILRVPEITRKYKDNWLEHRDHSRPFKLEEKK